MSARQAGILRQYVAWTTLLYSLGVTAAVWPGSSFVTGSVTGGIIAIGFGISALILLFRSQPHSTQFTVATGLAMAATPVAMAFNVALVAQVVTTIAALLLAMYLAAFYPYPRGPVLVVGFTCAVIVALLVAPARLTWFTYLALAGSIVLSAQMYGSLVNALISSATTDPLTGLLNRAGLELATTRMLSGVKIAHPVPVSLGILDVDRLKNVNDTRGHAAGDSLLAELAQHLCRCLPDATIVARIGGDEFVVFCVDTEHHQLVSLLAAVLETSPTTFTFGVSSARSASLHWPDVYRAADRALYLAKRARP